MEPKPGMLTHTCNARNNSDWKAMAGRLTVAGQSGLSSETPSY